MTNVLVSALKSKQGSSHKLLRLLAEDLYLPNISVPLFLEYEDVAKRQGMLSGLSSEDREGISINQFIASAVGEKMSALMTESHLKSRAQNGNEQDFLTAMSKVPDIEPDGADKL